MVGRSVWLQIWAGRQQSQRRCFHSLESRKTFSGKVCISDGIYVKFRGFRQLAYRWPVSMVMHSTICRKTSSATPHAIWWPQHAQRTCNGQLRHSPRFKDGRNDLRNRCSSSFSSALLARLQPNRKPVFKGENCVEGYRKGLWTNRWLRNVHLEDQHLKNLTWVKWHWQMQWQHPPEH